MPDFDFFLSHASEDKAEVAHPLADALKQRGYRVWYDRDILRVGDSLSRSIDSGLAQSRFGVVILSPAFFAKHWTKRELQGLVALDEQGRSKILPVWHRVTKQDVVGFSPILGDVIAARTSEGLAEVVEALVAAACVQERVPLSPRPGASFHEGGERRNISEVKSNCVIFIHGLYARPETWQPLINSLQENPLPKPWRFLTFNYSTRTNIHLAGQQFTEYVERQTASHPNEQLTIVAHSLGGLVALESILGSESIRNRMKGLVMISVSVVGFRPSGIVGFLWPVFRPLTPGGAEVERIRQEWIQRFHDREPFKISTVFGDRESVVPIQSLPGSTPIIIPGASHADVLYHNQLARIIRETIE